METFFKINYDLLGRVLAQKHQDKINGITRISDNKLNIKCTQIPTSPQSAKQL
jgi:hypothetical protein